MKRKRLSLKRPVLYVVSGLMHFIFMFFGYANEFSGLSIDSTRELYSVYGSIRFGDAAIGSYICGVAEQFDQAGKLTFFATLSTVFVLVSTVLAAVVLLHGVFGLIKGLAHIDMTPTLGDDAFDRRASLWAKLYQISVWLSAACLLAACLVNIQKSGGRVYCVLPGLGMILLFLAAVVTFILLCVFNKKAAARRHAEKAAIESSECPSCKAHVTSETLFCPVCGARINASVPIIKDAEAKPTEEDFPKPEVKPFPYSKYFGVFTSAMEEIRERAKRRGMSQRTVSVLSTLCVILMILTVVGQVAITVAILPEKQVSSPMRNDISAIYAEADRETQILTSGYILAETIPGSVNDVQYSLDGRTALMESRQGMEYVLYLCRGTRLEKLTNLSYAGHTLSADGTGIAYIDSDRRLVLYDVMSRQTMVVGSKPYGNFTLSPDGDAVLYRLTETERSPLYAYVDGTQTKLTDNGSPIGLTNDGRLIYYFDFDQNAVCLRQQNGETVILAETDSKNRKLTCYLNENHDELLFTLADKVYYVRHGGDAILLSDNGIKVMGDFANWCRENGDTLPIKSFAGQYYLDEGNRLYYVRKNGAVEVDTQVESFCASLSGDVVFYKTIRQALYRVESRSLNKKVKMASGVAAFILSPYGDYCYYIDGKNNFWMIKDDCKPRFVESNVLMGTVTREGNALFIIKNDETGKQTLYATKGAGKLLMIAEDVAAVTATYNRSYYFVAAGKVGQYAAYEIYSATYKLNFRSVKLLHWDN